MTHAGVYIHIPFCRSRCSYCDFATGMYDGATAERYVHALTEEISNRSQPVGAGLVPARDGQPRGLPLQEEPGRYEVIDTIYFGGGTPSLLSSAQIVSILNAVKDRFVVNTGAEITLEINPGDGGTTAASKRDGNDQRTDNDQNDRLDAALVRRESRNEFFRELRGLGINRASFGAQTFDDRELKQLGRTHSAADVTLTFHQLRDAGFENINFDLIAGLPGQTLDGWQRNLEEALKLRPEHLSLYLLDIHEGTPLADQIKSGMRPQPDEDLAAEMYATMIETVCAAGYEHYEISNFCLSGFESRHNSKYWTGAPYYGFGNSAHSYDGQRRRWANERDALKYVKLIDDGTSPIVECTDLSEADARSEAIFLGLRLMSGIDLQNYRSLFGRNLREEYNGELDRLSEAGLIEICNERLRLTSRGALLSNEVFAALA
jgi:oxygen-independent coproporphyrinogen III oxidase